MPKRPAPARDNLVRRHRQLVELTQAELAEQVGVSRQTIVSIESGGYAPSVYLALALAAALGTTVEALFEPTTEPVTGAEPAATVPTGGARVHRDR